MKIFYLFVYLFSEGTVGVGVVGGKWARGPAELK